MDWDLWLYSIDRFIWAGYPAVEIYRDNRAEIDMFASVDEIQHEGLLAMLGR